MTTGETKSFKHGLAGVLIADQQQLQEQQLSRCVFNC
jgi:hypothetical protein